MPSSTKPRRQNSTKTTSTRDSRSRRSSDSYGSQSTAPSSVYGSSRYSDSKSSGPSRSNNAHITSQRKEPQPCSYQEDESSPDPSLYPRSSVDTYASTTTSEEDLYRMDADEDMDFEQNSIPPLPVYRREVVEPNVRPSSPQDFAKLFPSLHRFTIRHDEFTPDGNMNLRVDTVVTGRRRTAIQLFHLRMYDLTKREFSLRRYCRDSGREVCSSKRKYEEPAESKPAIDERPSLQRSMSTAIKALSGMPQMRRRGSESSASSKGKNRPITSWSLGEDDEQCAGKGTSKNGSLTSLDSRSSKKSKSRRPVPTNTIKLEFSNYARVDVKQSGNSKSNKRYDFEWWGHKYSWKRSVDKQMGQVSFHLVRDGNGSAPVAHIVPEMRSPSQVFIDENAGGWVPPCFMWIADESVVDAVTDCADVIMATGLMALVDDCIKDRWESKKTTHRVPLPLTAKSVSIGNVSPKAVMQHVFGRRHSDHQPSSPLRYATPIAAY